MKYLKPLLFFVAFPTFLFAQSNYKPGYIVTPQGDTVKGLINYREWNLNPGTITFKKSDANAVGKGYGPNDIKGFGVDNLEKFIVYNGPITTDSTDPNKGTEGRDTSTRIATVFLKELEKGDKLALYAYKDELKSRFFIGEAPSYAPKELIFRIYNSGSEKTYQKQLNAEASKYNELTDKMMLYVSKADYNDDDILDIVSRINHISKADYNKNHYDGSAINLFAGAGLNIITSSPGSSGAFYAAGGRANTSFKPAVFLGLNLFVSPATKQLQLRVELSGAQNSYKSLYNSAVSPYKPTEASYSSTTITVSPQLIYNFYNAENFKVFAGAGLLAEFNSYSNSYLGTQNHDGSEADIQANSPYLFRGSGFGFLLKAGVQMTRNLEIFANYMSSTPVTSGGYFQMSASGEQVGLIYLFNLK